MIEIGNLNQFGFRIGPQAAESQLREVSIFFGGCNLTVPDNMAYLPSFVGQLASTANYLRSKINYLKHDELFCGLNVTQIHNLLLHGNPDQFTSDREWWSVANSHRFSDWGETTDGFATFLIPYSDRLYLTYQTLPCRWSPNDNVLEVVDAVETTLYYLITTIDDAVAVLKGVEGTR